MEFFKVISLILFIFLIMTAVSAGEKIAFEGVNFHIPDNFTKSDDIMDYTKLGSEGKTCVYSNDLNETIELTVVSDWMGMSLNDFKCNGAVKKTINGHEGWSYNQKSLYYFGYISDDKGILVGVSNQTYLNEIVQ